MGGGKRGRGGDAGDRNDDDEGRWAEVMETDARSPPTSGGSARRHGVLTLELPLPRSSHYGWRIGSERGEFGVFILGIRYAILANSSGKVGTPTHRSRGKLP